MACSARKNRSKSGSRAVAVTLWVLLGAGCSAGQLPAVSLPSRVAELAASADPIQLAVEAAINTFNAEAGGAAAAQQAVLKTLVAPGQATAQKACAAATSTVRLEPVYSRLAVSPGWMPASGTLEGTIYVLPTLIRIYTGTRVTGTDLSALHLAIGRGQMHFPAICLR